jgi:hypothetical protein
VCSSSHPLRLSLVYIDRERERGPKEEEESDGARRKMLACCNLYCSAACKWSSVRLRPSVMRTSEQARGHVRNLRVTYLNVPEKKQFS